MREPDNMHDTHKHLRRFTKRGRISLTIVLVSGTNLVPERQAQEQVTGSPVIGGKTVYSLDPGGGVLYALNAVTGEVRATLSVGPTTRFATPTLSQATTKLARIILENGGKREAR